MTESGSGSDADSAAESDAAAESGSDSGSDAPSEPGSVGRFRVLVVSASAIRPSFGDHTVCLRARNLLRNRSAA